MSSPASGRLLLLVTVLVVTINLRPPLTVVGPLLESIGQDTGLSPTMLGLLGSIPVLGFSVVSPLVSLVSARFGLEKTIFGALLLLAAGTLLRSTPDTGLLSQQASLYLGTVLLAAAIGVGNVLVPAVVKRDFPDRVALMTSLYTAIMVGAAASFSALAVPLGAVFGWEAALASPALLALLGAAAWSLRKERVKPQPAPTVTTLAGSRGSRPLLLQPLAWSVTIFFGIQSALFFVLLNWFPAIQTTHGVGETQAGYSLGLYQALGVVATLVVGHLMQRTGDQRALAAAAAGAMIIGLLGMIHLPDLMLLWAVFSGPSSGASLMLGMSFISLRAGSFAQVGRFSGMVQGLGYALAGVGPALAGLLYQAAGSWTPVLWTAVGLAACQLLAGLYAGRNIQLRD